MRLFELLNPITEGAGHPCIVVDVQPEYSGMHDGDENPLFTEIIEFVVNKQTGPVLMFVNAEDTGVSSDTINGIEQYWEDTINYPGGYDLDDDGEVIYPDEAIIDWGRFTIVDKGYGYFRGWMDQGIDEAAIIKVIRLMYQQKVSDSRELFDGDESETYVTQMEELGVPEKVQQDNLSINWASVSQLREFNGSYIMGGGRNQCLREVELLMNAFNIKYKRIERFIYG